MTKFSINLNNLAWKQICALLLCFSALIGSIGYAVEKETTDNPTSNLVVFGSQGKLKNYDGSIGVSIGNLSDIQLIGLSNGQILVYNSSVGIWQNINQSEVNHYSFGNLTNCAFVTLANGDIPVYNSSSGIWNNQQPFSTGWNATVSDLISNASINWEKISNANNTITQLIQNYILCNLMAGNVTATNLDETLPISACSYLIFPQIIGGKTYYLSKAANGTIISGWTSIDAARVLNLAANIAGNQNLFLRGNICF